MRYPVFWLWLKYVNRDHRIAGMLIGVLFGVFPLGIGALQIVPRLPFLLDGTTVQGTIVGVQLACRPTTGVIVAAMPLFGHGGGRRPKHIVNYEYLDEAGKRHWGKGRATRSEWMNAKVGDPIAVRYIRSAPENSQLASETFGFAATIPLIIGIVIVVSAVLYGSKGMRWAAQQVRLVSWGRAVCGTITRAEIEQRGARRKESVCILEYEDRATRLLTGKLELVGRPRPTWHSGAPILILVDPADATNHAADIFDARIGDREELIGRTVM